VLRDTFQTPFLECADLSALWARGGLAPRYGHGELNVPRLRQVAEDQSADRSAHSKKEAHSKLIVRLSRVVKTANVSAILHTRPANLVYDAVTTRQRSLECCIRCCHSQNPPTCGNEIACLRPGSPGVEDL
jgi:hypothetical protein